MKSNPFTWKWIVFVSIFIIVLGSIFHFTYEWSGENEFVASFSATNESVWEHLKLLLYPTVIACLIVYGFTKGNNLGVGMFLGLFFAIFTIMFLFYTYVGAFTHPDTVLAIDILIFIISGIIAALVSTYIFSQEETEPFIQAISWVGLVTLFLLFTVFTYQPPDVPIFVPPPESH